MKSYPVSSATPRAQVPYFKAKESVYGLYSLQASNLMFSLFEKISQVAAFFFRGPDLSLRQVYERTAKVFQEKGKGNTSYQRAYALLPAYVHRGLVITACRFLSSGQLIMKGGHRQVFQTKEQIQAKAEEILSVSSHPIYDTNAVFQQYLGSL